MKNIIFIFFVLFLSLKVNAQNWIIGKVSDDKNQPLAGATVFLPELNKGTISDENGKYIINNVPNGLIKIQFSFVGYNTVIQSIKITSQENVLNVNLSVAYIQSQEVVISGGYVSSQLQNAVKIDILKDREIFLSGTPNLMEAITRVPGVDMIAKGPGVAKPVIRGLSMNDVLVLNNGVRFENYQYSEHHPLGIDEFGIDNIEIIKGPASLLYGSDAIGGVLNFISEKPAPLNSMIGDYNLQMFSNSLGIVNNLGIKGSTEKFFGGFRFGHKSNADYLQGGGDFVPNSRFDELSLKMNFGFSGTKGLSNIYYTYHHQNLGLVEDEAVEEINQRGRHCRIFYQQFNTHLLTFQNKYYFSNIKLDANISYQNTELIHFGKENEYEIQMTLATTTYETKLYLPSSKNSEYIIGFQGIHQQNTNLNDRETKLLPNARMNNYSGFALLQHTFFKQLKIQTGLRYDYKTIATKAIGLESDTAAYRPALNRDYNSMSGSLGATYNVSNQLLLRANFALAYRTPNLAELTSKGQHETRYELGDPNLVPENSYAVDASLHYHGEFVTFDLAGFYNKIRHYIFISPTRDSTTSGIRIYHYLQADATLYGGEAGIKFHSKSIPYLQAEVAFSTVVGKKYNGDYLPFIPANKLKYELNFEKKKLAFFTNPSFSISAITAFAQNKPAIEETPTPGYTIFNLGLDAEISFSHQSILIGIKLNDVFDKKYVDHLSTLKTLNFYDPGRNLSISLKIPFAIKSNHTSIFPETKQ
jgi:iron complex outermembrane receptor protein